MQLSGTMLFATLLSRRSALPISAISPHGTWELSWKDRQIEGRKSRRQSELAVLLGARFAVRDFDAAGKVAHSLIELRPTASVGFGKLALVERAAGRAAAAADAL